MRAEGVGEKNTCLQLARRMSYSFLPSRLAISSSLSICVLKSNEKIGFLRIFERNSSLFRWNSSLFEKNRHILNLFFTFQSENDHFALNFIRFPRNSKNLPSKASHFFKIRHFLKKCDAFYKMDCTPNIGSVVGRMKSLDWQEKRAEKKAKDSKELLEAWLLTKSGPFFPNRTSTTYHLDISCNYPYFSLH